LVPRDYNWTKTVVLTGIVVFTAFFFLGETPSAQEQKEKKPRFELTSTTLRDGKAKLEWLLQQDGKPFSLSWYKTAEYVASLNKDRHVGFRDWRMPTREELLSLIDYAKGEGFDGSAGREMFVVLQKIGLAHVQDEHLWSATDDMYNDRFAWAVDMKTGVPERIEKHLYENVIVVRKMKK